MVNTSCSTGDTGMSKGEGYDRHEARSRQEQARCYHWFLGSPADCRLESLVLSCLRSRSAHPCRPLAGPGCLHRLVPAPAVSGVDRPLLFLSAHDLDHDDLSAYLGSEGETYLELVSRRLRRGVCDPTECQL